MVSYSYKETGEKAMSSTDAKKIDLEVLASRRRFHGQ
jgi:hypothetical protein